MRQEIESLCDWISLRSISIIDGISQPEEVVGSVFANENGNGMSGYVTKLFTAKNTFKEYEWFKEIPVLRKDVRVNPYKTR